MSCLYAVNCYWSSRHANPASYPLCVSPPCLLAPVHPRPVLLLRVCAHVLVANLDGETSTTTATTAAAAAAVAVAAVSFIPARPLCRPGHQSVCPTVVVVSVVVLVSCALLSLPHNKQNPEI